MKFKKILALALALCMINSVVSPALADEFAGDIGTVDIIPDQPAEEIVDICEDCGQEPCVCESVVEYCAECGEALTEGHVCAEEEPQEPEVPVVEKCECGLEKGHEGDCAQLEPVVEYCAECGEVLTEGHECAEEPVCTCVHIGDEHMPDCALYEEPEVDAEALALYEELMATESIEEFDAILSGMTEAEINAFADAIGEEMVADIDAHLLDLEEAGLEVEEEVEEEDTREIVYHVPTVDFTDAAPFLDPVEGEEPVLFRMVSPLSLMAAAEEEEDDNGLKLDKSVSEPDEKGVYTLTLESWATGAKTTIKQESNIPTDIILVLDQSGSMDDNFTSTSYRETSGTPAELYSNRSKLYVKIGDGTYSPVNVTRTQDTTGEHYEKYPNQDNSDYYSAQPNLYHLCSDGVYGKVTVNRSGGIMGWGRTYSYTCANGCTLNVGNNNSGDETPDCHNQLYIPEYQYTFSYEKADGSIETATVRTSGSAPDWDFYESYASGNTTRLAALKSAVTTFVGEVATKAKGTDGVLDTEDDVDHKIAMIGFASAGDRGHYNMTPYENTELFVGGTSYLYNNNPSAHYDSAFQDMSTEDGIENISDSIDALDAYGGTFPTAALDMANGVFEANPVQPGKQRNRVVIVFTDGQPGTGNSVNTTEANSAISNAYISKNTYGATVYTVGIFTGADATGTTLPSNSGDTTERANRFMHLLSSNYPESKAMDVTGTTSSTMPNTGYYLSASDSSALNSIFRTISQNIESGGSSITLDETAVVKDVITDQFVLPEGTKAEDILVYTSEVDETTGEFKTPEKFTAAEVTLSADGRTVSVTNFDFADNWVGTETAADGTVTYRGKKLIILIPIEVREGFLGGNGVLTNGEGSGVFENKDAEKAIEEFESPKVDVIIKTPEIYAHDQVIYYGNDAPEGNVLITHEAVPSAESELWKVAYVNVTLPSTGDVSNTECGEYTGTITVTPKTSGTYKATTNSATAKVHVLVPTAVCDEITIYQGNQPVFTDPTSIKWVDIKEGTEMAATMGEEPDVTFSYAPAANTANAFMDCTKVTPTIAITGTTYTDELSKFDVHVIIPEVTVHLTDDQHYYGAEYTKTDVTGFTTTLNWVKELNGHTDIPQAQGTAPEAYEVSLKYFTDSTKENELTSFVMPNEDVPVYVKAYHGDKVIEDATFTTTCAIEGEKCLTHNGGYFTVHPLTCSLTVKKDGWSSLDPNEAFIITVTGDNVTYPVSLKISVHGGDENGVTIKGLPVGNYSVEEDSNWSWRYKFESANSVKLEDSAIGTITVTNSRQNIYWLDFAAWCQNIFDGNNTVKGGTKGSYEKN